MPSSKILSASLSSFTKIGYTPHSSESFLKALSLGVIAIISVCGLNFEIALAVPPLFERLIIALAPKLFAILTALFAIEFVMPSECFSANIPETLLYSSPSSVEIAILAIISTDLSGYFPAAVSPESITALVPSIIAFATSITSALVGLGFLIIESSICVAVIEIFPASLHFFMSSF